MVCFLFGGGQVNLPEEIGQDLSKVPGRANAQWNQLDRRDYWKSIGGLKKDFLTVRSPEFGG